MKLNLLTRGGALFALPLIMVSCVDDNYDLSDIDTTTRISVNDLTIPVNIDPVTLGDVITFDENSKIQPVTIGGKEFYALSEKGSFGSDPITIAGVSATPSPLSPTHETLESLVGSSGKPARTRSTEYVKAYKLEEIGNDFSYNSIKIDDAIVKINSVTTDSFEFKLTLQVVDQSYHITDMVFSDMLIRAPKGLTCTPSTGTYDPATGYWRVDRVQVQSSRAEIYLTATGVNFDQGGYGIRADRTLEFSSEFRIQSGVVTVTADGLVLPDQVDFYIYYGVDNLKVKTFTGDIKYDLEGISIAPVTLSDIPDFLQGDETNLELANPQLYLSINNPVGDVPLDCQTGFLFTAIRDNGTARTFRPDENVVIGHNYGVAGPYNFVLTPEGNQITTPADFATNLKRIKFNSLGGLLAGSGLPSQIRIDLENPCVPTQHVDKFAIPSTLPKVEGKYELLAPLALNDGSHIIYTETRSGWGGDDLDNLTVTALTLTAKAVNNCPVALELTIYPIDAEGNNINGAVIKSTRLEAGATSDLEITLEGEVKNLDGIRLQAVLDGGGSEALAPSQTLSLTEIRAKVSGYYEKEF